MKDNQQEVFQTAQKYETNWWVRHLTQELAPPSRDWLVGYQDHVGRGHMARMRLNDVNRFWSADPPAITGSILDLGSGIVSFFEGKTMEVWAVEPTLIAMREHFPELVIIGMSRNVNYLPGEIYGIPDDCVDNVWCCNMLDHTPDWAAILNVEIPRVLKPKGRLYLSVDCREGNVKMDAGHLTAFSPSMLLRHLKPNFEKVWFSAPQDKNYYRWDYVGIKRD